MVPELELLTPSLIPGYLWSQGILFAEQGICKRRAHEDHSTKIIVPFWSAKSGT
jgi:hypothetical protein